MHDTNWHALCHEQGKEVKSAVFSSILDSFKHLRVSYAGSQNIDVLVTGSLHLIGASMLALNDFKISLENR